MSVCVCVGEKPSVCVRERETMCVRDRERETMSVCEREKDLVIKERHDVAVGRLLRQPWIDDKHHQIQPLPRLEIPRPANRSKSCKHPP